MKPCRQCGIEKELTEFYAHKMMADGRLNICKVCKIEYARVRRLEHPETIAAIDKKRGAKPERKKKVLAYQRARRARSPEKNAARSAVRQAIKTGRLVKLPCEHCGSLSVQAHHEDYAKPLDVRWLCFVCHRVEHGQLRHLQGQSTNK